MASYFVYIHLILDPSCSGRGRTPLPVHCHCQLFCFVLSVNFCIMTVSSKNREIGNCRYMYTYIVFHLHCLLFCGILPAITLHSSERNGQRNCAQGQWSAPAYRPTHQSDHTMQKVGFVVFLAFLRFFTYKSNLCFFWVQLH